jgi:hypothetical protein
MRRSSIKNMLMALVALVTLGMSSKKVPEAHALLSPNPNRFHSNRYPERGSRVKCKGRRDASQRSRSNRRKK